MADRSLDNTVIWSVGLPCHAVESRLGGSKREGCPYPKSYNPQAALASSGVYGVVSSGETTVTLYLRSSRAVDSVAPAHPVPTTTTFLLCGCFATYGIVAVVCLYKHEIVQ